MNDQLRTSMNSYELAIKLELASSDMEYGYVVNDYQLLSDSALMLRQQQAQIESLETLYETAIEATKEKAAKVCEEIVIENGGKTARNKTSFECAEAIRSMK